MQLERERERVCSATSRKNSYFKRCLPNTCHVPGVIFGVRDMVVCKPGRNPCPCQITLEQGSGEPGNEDVL